MVAGAPLHPAGAGEPAHGVTVGRHRDDRRGSARNVGDYRALMTTQTLVLLHGAGTGAWVWERVVAALTVPAVALDVPGRRPGVTPQKCAAGLAGELDRRGVDRLVVVLHSLAGVLAPGLADRLGDRLAGCIYVAGVVPPDGGAFVDALPLPNRLILRLLFRLKQNGLTPSPAMIRRELCNDLDEADAERVVARYEAEMPGLYLSAAGPMPTRPRCSYIRLLKDRSVPIALQDAMIARLPVPRVDDVDAGHLAMLSAPAALAAVLERAASPADGA